MQVFVSDKGKIASYLQDFDPKVTFLKNKLTGA